MAVSGGGIHFRFSDEIGAQIGQQVANYGLCRLKSLGKRTHRHMRIQAHTRAFGKNGIL